MNKSNYNLIPVVNTADMSAWTDFEEVAQHAWILNRQGGARILRNFGGKVIREALLAYIKEIGATIIYETSVENALKTAFEREDCFVVVNHYSVEIAASSLEVGRQIESEIEKCFAPKKILDERVQLNFVCRGRCSVNRTSRQIVAPYWAEIESNYPSMIRSDLSDLTNAVHPVGGRLLLLTGDPGSGKTTFTRALIRQWQGWCKPIFVIDPEAFFDDSKYMTELLADAEEDDSTQVCNDDEVREPKPWLLYIIEDADEYLTADGKARHGQAVSRALNLLDGMLGQGLNMLMLFSANLPEDKLNPAFIRPGRCLSKIEFGYMDTESAIAWMVQNGLDPELLQEVGNTSLGFRRRQGFSLAELYAIKNRSAEAVHAEVA